MKSEQKSNVRVTGEIRVRVFGADGKLKHEVTKKNLVVDAGLELIANRLTDATPLSGLLVNYIAVGTGTDTPDASDTTLQTETTRKLVSSRANDGAIGAISTVFNAGEIAPSILKEVGLFIDGSAGADTGSLFARQNIDVEVTALDAVFIDWRITLAAA